MNLLQVVTVFAACCLFRFTMGQHSGKKFTMEPPDTVFANQDSDAIFHWTLTFGDHKAWLDFSQIYWGEADKKGVNNKYMTVQKNGKVSINNMLQPLSLQSRLDVRKNITQREWSLDFVLKNVTRADETITYGCKADFSGEDYPSGPIRLAIQVPPQITRRPNATIDVEEGERVKLPCDATGDPVPLVEWTKNDQVLQSTNSTNELLIPKIELKHGGSYVCRAKNDAGSRSYSVLIRVIRYHPYINKTVSSSVVKSWMNHVTTLKCAADANPTANFTWLKDGRQISSSFNLHNIATLLIKPSKPDDFGSYLCKSANVKGTSLHNITVEQLFGPGPPIINQLVPDMLSISITWNKSRDDGGSIILDYMIQLLDANNTERRMQSGVTDNKYTLQNLKQNRTYRIVIRARNVVGYGEATNATVSTLEAALPIILSITTVPSLVSVNISWSSTNNNTGIKILDYKIILVDTTTQERRQFIGVTVSNLSITRLKHNRTYMIKVQARNEDGYGRFKTRAFTTLEADPPGPPVIEAFPRVFEFEVSWNSSLQDLVSIKILDYRIRVWDGSLLIQEHKAVTGRSLVIEHLSRNKTYVIQIQARNEVGYGQKATISARTLLEGPPDAPTITNITIQGRQCLLQWTKPYDGERPIEAYTVSVWITQASNSSRSKETWNTTETSYLLDLRWNHNYTAAISAWNSYGQSFYGSERHFRTGNIDPGSSTTVGTEPYSPSPNTKQSKTGESGDEEDQNNKNTFTYLVPLWIVVLAFAVPAVLFMLWKATKKIIRMKSCKKRPPSRGPRQFHNRDSESSATTLEDVNENKEPDHYESITEIFEMNYNHGYNADDENLGDREPRNSRSTQETTEYNHLYETPPDTQQTTQNKKQIGLVRPTKLSQNELQSGLGILSNHVYSHLIHSDSLIKRQSPVQNEYSTIPFKSKWEISRSWLKLERTVGCCQFGLVKKGYALDVDEKGGWVPVAVKILNDNGEANELCRQDLLAELEMMKSLSPHKHVIQLLACITESEPICVITEFAPYGDLLGFLRKKRGLEDDYYYTDHLPARSVTSHKLMQFACEIADGMAHLSSAKIIHRDLAARNVLLSDGLTCKVTDFGMPRDIREDMYQKPTGGRLPVKWTALEALLNGLYTTKSDVWSFGVLLFEIVTMGGSPYPDMEVLDLIHRLAAGYRIEKPIHVSDRLYDVMLSCWDEDPDTRPSFPQLKGALKQLDKEKQVCINLKTYDGRLYENEQTLSR